MNQWGLKMALALGFAGVAGSVSAAYLTGRSCAFRVFLAHVQYGPITELRDAPTRHRIVKAIESISKDAYESHASREHNGIGFGSYRFIANILEHDKHTKLSQLAYVDKRIVGALLAVRDNRVGGVLAKMMNVIPSYRHTEVATLLFMNLCERVVQKTKNKDMREDFIYAHLEDSQLYRLPVYEHLGFELVNPNPFRKGFTIRISASAAIRHLEQNGSLQLGQFF